MGARPCRSFACGRRFWRLERAAVMVAFVGVLKGGAAMFGGRQVRYLVTAEEMRFYEKFTVDTVGIAEEVLMERAALAAFARVQAYLREHPDRGRDILVMAGMGNNGGDGLALARLLAEADCRVEVWCLGDESRASGQWRRQRGILGYCPVSFSNKPLRDEYTVMVDALFGTGLSREVDGAFGEAVERFQRLLGYRLALDLPSGIDSDNGSVWGRAVCADETVTFGFCKRGLALYPGCERAGKVTMADIGISPAALAEKTPGTFALEGEPEELLPKRSPQGNKGTFGKVLLAAGSFNMAGAAILSARAAYRAGAGMVKVITVPENREILQGAVPEALLGTPGELREGMEWADVIAIGPGMGTGGTAREMLVTVLQESSLPLLMDADALNLLAADRELREMTAACGRAGRSIVLTPHVGELARLTGRNVEEIKEDLAARGGELAMELQAVTVAKDARTFICAPGRPTCINLSGNSGLATAGSGDVLAGMVAGLMAQGMDTFHAACVGAYLHGRAGDRVAAGIGEHACMAGDLV